MLFTLLLFPAIYAFDPPLGFEDLLRLLQQVLPILVGFLASAIGFAFGASPDRNIREDRYQMLVFILNWSFIFYWIGMLVAIAVYLYSHCPRASVGAGMSKDILFGLVTLMLSVVTGMAGLISSKLFSEEPKP